MSFLSFFGFCFAFSFSFFLLLSVFGSTVVVKTILQ